jgi:hypothetical protein
LNRIARPLANIAAVKSAWPIDHIDCRIGVDPSPATLACGRVRLGGMIADKPL